MDRPGLTRPFLQLLFTLWISSTIAKNLENPRYETAYACEGKLLKIECKEGEVIRLIRANYGRFSITICNDHGNTDWSVNCMSTKSYTVLHQRCVESSCSIQATTSTFGDPCPGTLKYLEAHYQCISVQAKTTTGRPSPPWLITSQPPSVWSTISPTRPPPPPPKVSAITTWTPTAVATGKYSSSSSNPTITTPQPPQQPAQQPVKPVETPVETAEVTPPLPPQKDVEVEVEKKAEKEETTVGVSSVAVKVTEETTPVYSPTPTPWTIDLKKCWPVTARNLYWNWTGAGERAVQPCPGGATGLARWRCVPADPTVPDSQPHWQPATPDLSECRSVWLTSLESRVIEGDSLISITNDLSQVTSSKTLYGGDMMITTKIIKKMAQKMSEDIQTFPDQRQREAIVTELLQSVVRTGSNLLDSSQHPSWRDLSYKEQMRVATSLLIGLEENAFLLADTVVREKTVEHSVKNIMLSVRVLDTKNIKSATFPSEASTDSWSASNDWLELPKGALLENSEGGLVRLVFVAFDRLEEILQWQPESVFETDNQQKNLTRILNSKIISASLGKGRHIQLSEPVRLFLKHLKTENVSNPSCVFWDYTMSTWSEEGCHVESTNRTHTTCLCDHLTNFAILMDIHATSLPVGHQIALQIITYIGCIVSIVCLILTFLTFQIFRALKSDRTTIHKHLCFCLLVAETLFVVGIGQTSNRVMCGVIAGLLHLFFLCAFAWMFLEGFQLYVMLIEVFEADKSRLKWYYTLAYGIPLFIVCISAIIDPYSYGTKNYCWLRADNFFIFSFVGPVILVLIANVIFLAMAVTMMCRHGNAAVSIKSKEHSRLASASGEEENALQSKLQSARGWLRGSFILVFLLGLTWTFGLLYLNQESVVMAYVFTIFNSLQGFFIFVFHCVQNEKVRKEYHKYIRQQSWLPKCLRCSKSSSSSAAAPAGAGGSSGSKDVRGAALYPQNSSNLNSHVDSGTSQYISQKNWNSRSCTTMNRVGKSPVLVNSSPVGSAVATTSRNSGGSGDSDVVGAEGCSPTLSQGHVPPICGPGHAQRSPYDDEFTLNAINNATLPYFRNSQHKGSPDTNSITNTNFPKSASSWGPLHKPVHWKSFSRDSGHGASEQEESPHSHMMGSEDLNECRFTKQNNRKPLKSSNLSMDANIPNTLPINTQAELAKYMYNQYQPGKYQTGGKRKNGQRSTSPWNHTYTEIHDGQRAYGKRGSAMLNDDDPVYEEIERNEIQVSDMSDEDGKRQSDMSRQSSRSYGDHRPLIPAYSPAIDRPINQCFEINNHKYQPPNRYLTTGDYRVYHRGNDNPARSLAAVLDGETVVCHLEPSQMFPHDNAYSARTMVFSPYSDS